MTDGGKLIQLTILAIFAGGGILYSGLKRRTRARAIEEMPRSKIATAPQGLVEVEGFAWPNENRVARSSSGFENVYYELQLQREESRGSGKNRRKVWVTIFTHRHAETFYICDATGIALVDPQDALIEVHQHTQMPWK